MQITYEEMRDVVFNTLDFCGPVLSNAREHCVDEGYEWGQREEQLAFKAAQEYMNTSWKANIG